MKDMKRKTKNMVATTVNINWPSLGKNVNIASRVRVIIQPVIAG